MSGKRILTGIKATGVHIGNWVGAIEPALEVANDPSNESFLFIADYHALNTNPKPEVLKQNTYEIAATWLALGLDLKHSHLYRQSDIPEIFELSVILNGLTPKGLMNRAHAYKAQVQDNVSKGNEDIDDGINMGLYTYPILMTADILAFNADQVPVGIDQTQHIEIARDIAQKFNSMYGETFKLPAVLLSKKVKLLPGLDGRKMSASYGNHISVFLEEKALRKAVMKIVSDSTPAEEPKSTKDNLLFDFYSVFATPEQIASMAEKYEKGIGWGFVKQEIFEVLNEKLKGPRQMFNDLMADKSQLDKILLEGASAAREIASKNLKEVRLKIGMTR
jgi:tryptophanyl-tRNA synthetase